MISSPLLLRLSPAAAAAGCDSAASSPSCCLSPPGCTLAPEEKREIGPTNTILRTSENLSPPCPEKLSAVQHSLTVRRPVSVLLREYMRLPVPRAPQLRTADPRSSVKGWVFVKRRSTFLCSGPLARLAVRSVLRQAGGSSTM